MLQSRIISYIGGEKVMVIETNRLMLKRYTMDDLDDYIKLKSCNEIWRYSIFKPLTEEEQARKMLSELISAYINNEYGFLKLELKDTREFVGEAGIINCNANSNRCVIGYNLLPKFWNNGYATEITQGIVKYVFESLEYERIEALALQINYNSCRVLEKSGFVLEGVLRNFNKCGDEYRNVCYYAMIKSDYHKLQS